MNRQKDADSEPAPGPNVVPRPALLIVEEPAILCFWAACHVTPPVAAVLVQREDLLLGCVSGSYSHLVGSPAFLFT